MHLFPNTQSLPLHLNVFSELYIYLSDMFKSVFTLKKGYFFLSNEKRVRSLNNFFYTICIVWILPFPSIQTLVMVISIDFTLKHNVCWYKFVLVLRISYKLVHLKKKSRLWLLLDKSTGCWYLFPCQSWIIKFDLLRCTALNF